MFSVYVFEMVKARRPTSQIRVRYSKRSVIARHRHQTARDVLNVLQEIVNRVCQEFDSTLSPTPRESVQFEEMNLTDEYEKYE